MVGVEHRTICVLATELLYGMECSLRFQAFEKWKRIDLFK